MESLETLECEVPSPSNNPLTKDGESGVASSSPDIVDDSQPAKKQTRQWAAWTRQEEESFFNALRQFGKNFEKITCRVQSKNKDQVRHYYYRLVRRMNKLLGPEFSLDAKNSKDTNAAMLRWWSLLEKYSCKASKLHLKPRRFKIFIDALEHQLLKDRKKNIRKRPSQGENSSSGSPTSVSVHGKPSGHDNRAVKVVIDDSQSIQKVGSGKGSSVKRNVNTGSSRGNNKVNLSAVKAVKQRRRNGGTASAAYKRWERAAIAGVSLVADAAEHLERTTTTNGKVSPAEVISNEPCSREVAIANGLEGFHSYNHCTSSNNQIVESSLQPPMKLKLQLFPIDEVTRRALEKDEHNPHLELTLSARKKISSVLEHLNRKWGNSTIASGELMLFPYTVERDNLAGHLKWRHDTAASAADVYAAIGSPQVFRMRYGWFCNIESANDNGGRINKRLWEDMDNMRASSGVSLSAGAWADSLTNVSIGDLLTETPPSMETEGAETPIFGSSTFLQQTPFTCDSFDAAIAAHISRHRKNLDQPTAEVQHASSILDAEETCDAFSFQKFPASFRSTGPALENCLLTSSSISFRGFDEELPDKGNEDDAIQEEEPVDANDLTSKTEDSTKDLGGLTDLYWPDSLGPLDLDMPSSRYHCQDLLCSDSISLSGLNRLIANSVDAFQNCSFFGSDKKETPSTSDALVSAPLVDHKIGGEV
ncbi:hypothetical protein Scep_016313 [Stephania cephalantha]|uniref:TSL-kinase interacting protein 1 n=1 Tax=Stephania cephalantha TaxID=152367 RepID=A0AAP0IMY3_9MAGN